MDQYPPQNLPNYPPPAGYPPQPGYPTHPGAASLPTAPYPGGPGFPPPGYPQQPGYMPGQPPGRKSRAGLWITLLALVVALGIAGGIGYFVIIPKLQQISPDGTLQTFCEGYKNLNAQEVYGTLSAQEQATTSESTLQTSFGLFKSLGVTINSCTVSNVQVNGSTATATITLSLTALGQTQTKDEPVNLVLENGAWKINQVQSPTQP